MFGGDSLTHLSRLGRIITPTADYTSRRAASPWAWTSLAALRSKDTNTSPPSQRPSNAITPSAKSPPESRTSNPASTAGRFTTTFAALIRSRIFAEMSAAGILYVRDSTHTSSHNAGEGSATTAAPSSSPCATEAWRASSPIIARRRTLVSAVIFTVHLPRPQQSLHLCHRSTEPDHFPVSGN